MKMKRLGLSDVIRSSTPGFEHRIWKVVGIGWASKGYVLTIQNDPKLMENRPSRVTVEYIIKLEMDGETTFPTIQEVKRILNGDQEGILVIDNQSKSLSEWRKNKEDTIDLMKSFTNWGE